MNLYWVTEENNGIYFLTIDLWVKFFCLKRNIICRYIAFDVC